MSFKKVCSILVAASMLTGLLAGCGQSSSDSTEKSSKSEAAQETKEKKSSEDVKELVLWDHHTDKEAEFLAKQVEEYNSTHPDVHITLEQIPWDDYIGTKMATAFASGEGPDIFEVFPGSILKYANAGMLAPMNEYLTEEQLADFSEASIEGVTVDEDIVAIPFEVEPLGLYYDIDKLEAKGVKPPKTWDEMIAAAKALAEEDSAGITIETVKGGHQDFQWYPWLWQLGGSVYTEDMKGSALDSPEVAKSLELWRTMFESGAANLKPSRQGSDIGMLGDGETAMEVCGSWVLVMLETVYKDRNIGVVPLPIPEGGEAATVAGGWKMAVNSQSKYVDEAADFVTWLFAGDVERSLDWCTNVKFAYSPRKSVVEAGKEIYSKGLRKVFTEEILDTAIPEMRLPAEVTSIIEDMIQAAYFDRGTEVKDTTKKAHEELESFLADYDGNL